MDYGRILANGVIAGGAALIASAFMLTSNSLQVGILTAIIIGIVASAKEYLIENPPKTLTVIQQIQPVIEKLVLF